MSAPRVTVGIPVFNGENYLQAAIDSILQQDMDQWELLISDNASTDGTQEICREACARDSRVRYFRNEHNVGAAGNYNRLVHEGRGDYFKWAAHDDECHPSMLRRCVETLDAAPASVVMVYPLAELIDDNGSRLEAPLDRIESRDHRPHRRLSRLLWALNMCDPIFGVIRMSALKRTQLIGRFFGADYVLLGELLMLGQIWEVDEVLFRLRAHAKRSMKANASARERAAWYDPASLRKRLVLPDWERMVVELLRSAAHAPLSVPERWKCCFSIAGTHYWRRFRNAGGRWKAGLKDALGLSRAPRNVGKTAL